MMSRKLPTAQVAEVWSSVMITGGSISVLPEAAADAAADDAVSLEDDEQPASTAMPRRAAALTAAAVRMRVMSLAP